MNTSKHSLTQILPFLLICLFLFPILTTQSQSLQPLQCLFEKQVKINCIRQLDIQKLQRQSPEHAGYVCPVLMGLLEKSIGLEHKGKGNMAMIHEIEKKVEKACQIGKIQSQSQNGYLLFGYYLIKGPFNQALNLQYELFFNDPFNHQVKFNQVLQRYKKYLEQQQISPTPDQYEPTSIKSQKAIHLFYESKQKQSLSYLKSLPPHSDHSLNFLQLRILQKNGQFPQALTLINQLIKNNSNSNNGHWYYLHIRGNLLMHHLKFKEAILSFEQSIAMRKQVENKYFGFSFYNIGLCYQKLGEFKKSIAYFKNVLNVKHDCVQAMNSLGFSYYSMISDQNSEQQNKQNQKSSQKYFQKAINTNPSYHMTYYNYAILKYQTGNYKEAAQYFKQSLTKTTNNTNTSSKYGLFKALYKTDKEKAKHFFNQEIISTKDIVYSEIGLIFYQLGEKEEAMKYLDMAVEKKNNLGEVYEWKGIIYYEEEKYELAKECFRKALEYGNNKASIWYNLGYIQILAENYERALGLLKKSQELDPEGPAKQQIKQANQKLKHKSKSKQQSEL